MCTGPRGSSRRIGLEAEEKVDFILAMFSLTPAAAVGGPILSPAWPAVPERFLFDGGGGAEPSAGLFLQDL